MINRCVKCGSKFTSPEKPLKLLPCLHSMCLDCLYGRIPVRRNSQHVETAVPTEKQEENKEQPVSSIATNDVEDTTKNKDNEAETDINKTIEELANLAESESAPSSGTDAPSESPNLAPDTATTCDKVDAVLSNVDNDAVNSESSESHMNEENIEAGPSETNAASIDVDKSISPKKELEVVDIKPKPVTGRTRL